MCRISKETVVQANKASMTRKNRDYSSCPIGKDGVVVSTKYNGKTYSKKITYKQIRESYAKALNAVL